MRASRYFLFFYAAMALLPAILLLIMLVSVLNLLVYLPVLSLLLALDLLVFGVLGFAEVFHFGKVSHKLKIVSGNDNTKKNSGVTLEVKRFSPDQSALRTDSYSVVADKFTTVLDALIDVKHKQDNSLSVRYSCRMGICGSCGVSINGKPALACETNLESCCKDGKVVVEPMMAHPLLKDLVTSFDVFLEQHKSISPGIHRHDNKEKLEAKQFYDQKPDDINKFLPYSYCIMCGLCNDACPVVNTTPEFIGPQALSQAYRYIADSRDQKERITAIDRLTGLWGCEFAGACSAVCPKGVDPASAIQLLKAEAAKEYLNIDSKKDEV